MFLKLFVLIVLKGHPPFLGFGWRIHFWGIVSWEFNGHLKVFVTHLPGTAGIASMETATAATAATVAAATNAAALISLVGASQRCGAQLF